MADILPGVQSSFNAGGITDNVSSMSNPTPSATVGMASNASGNAVGARQYVPGQSITEQATTNAAGANTADLSQLLNLMKPTLEMNNQLVAAKNLVYKQMYDSPLTDAEKKTLTPGLQLAMESGNRSLIDSQIRGINDQIKGLGSTIDSSVSDFLTYQSKLNDSRDSIAAAISKDPNLANMYNPADLQSMGIDTANLGIGVVGGYDMASYATNPNNLNQLNQIYSNPTLQAVTDADSAQTYINQYAPNSPITGQMIMDVANQTGVDPKMLLTVAQNESNFGTAGLATSTYNPGNVGNTDNGSTQNYGNWESGLMGMAQNLAGRYVGTSSTTSTADLSGVGFSYQVAQKVAPGISQADYSNAIQVVDGGLAPDELSKRATSYSAVLAAANAYSQAKNGTPFSFADAEQKYKFSNNSQTQNTLNFLSSLVGGDQQNPGGGNLDELVSLSNQIPRTQLPALNDVAAWTKLQTGNPAMASYYAAATEVSDQVAKILQGGGTGGGTSDAKLQQAQELFNTGFTSDQVTAVASTLKTLLANRKQSMIANNPYLQQYADVSSSGATDTSGTGGDITSAFQNWQQSNGGGSTVAAAPSTPNWFQSGASEIYNYFFGNNS